MSKLSFPSWRQRLARSLHINRSQVQSRYYQVASVSADGAPKNRTMVFRGFLSDCLSLMSVTDVRSEKMADWKGEGTNKFEICWYFSGSREQYRIAGEVVLVSKDSLRKSNDVEQGQDPELHTVAFMKQQWANLSGSARASFFGPTPKAPFDDQPIEINSESQTSNSENKNEADKALDISDNFCVVIFKPLAVDYLNLKSKPQLRCVSEAVDNWKELEVNA